MRIDPQQRLQYAHLLLALLGMAGTAVAWLWGLSIAQDRTHQAVDFLEQRITRLENKVFPVTAIAPPRSSDRAGLRAARGASTATYEFLHSGRVP